MSLFAKQPGFCPVCGNPDLYEWRAPIGLVACPPCSPACWEEARLRYTNYVLGKKPGPPEPPSVPQSQ